MGGSRGSGLGVATLAGAGVLQTADGGLVMVLEVVFVPSVPAV